MKAIGRIDSKAKWSRQPLQILRCGGDSLRGGTLAPRGTKFVSSRNVVSVTANRKAANPTGRSSQEADRPPVLRLERKEGAAITDATALVNSTRTGGEGLPGEPRGLGRGPPASV